MNDSFTLPSERLLQRLAISESGFVFDPVTGCSFNVNDTGIALLYLLQHNNSIDEIVSSLCEDWDVSPNQAERDLMEFANELRKVLAG